MKKIFSLMIFVLLFATLFSVFAAAKSCGGLKCLPDVAFALDDDGPPKDVILLTQITLDIGNNGYENLPFGISEVYSKFGSLDDKVTIVIHFGDVEIILGKNDDKIAQDFSKDLKRILEKGGTNTKITFIEDLKTTDLTKLYKTEQDEPVTIKKVEEEVEDIPKPVLISEPVPELISEVKAEEEKVETIEPVEVVKEEPKNIVTKIFSWIFSWFS